MEKGLSQDRLVTVLKESVKSKGENFDGKGSGKRGCLKSPPFLEKKMKSCFSKNFKKKVYQPDSRRKVLGTMYKGNEGPNFFSLERERTMAGTGATDG